MDEAKLTQLLGPESARLAIETMQRWQVVDETHVVIDRERLKRLLAIVQYAVDNNGLNTAKDGSFLIYPGDLDPIP